MWEYPYDKFRLYLKAVEDLRGKKLEDLFEVALTASRGDPESVSRMRKSLKGN